MNKKKKRNDDDEERESRYMRMVRAVFKVCQRQAIPRYSSRFSRKDFTLWQHMSCWS